MLRYDLLHHSRTFLSGIQALFFLFNILGPLPQAQAVEFHLPSPGTELNLSAAFNPPVLKGIKVYPKKLFCLDFIMDKGDGHLSKDMLKQEASKLVKYFLASLTIPEGDLWVNLSPYEKNKMIPFNFGRTEMGNDLLKEDYMLKQMTASLIDPLNATGKQFWRRVYQEAERKFGTTNIPVDTFNKVWIVPEKAVVYENEKAQTAYVIGSQLKVMLEEDYLSLTKHRDRAVPANSTHSLGKQVLEEIIIPKLTEEVNHGKNFSQLRQIHNSLILATWYKKKIRDSILNQKYSDRNKIGGIKTSDLKANQKIYAMYLQAFKKGAFNFIRDDQDPVSGQVFPRKYFSGGWLGRQTIVPAHDISSVFSNKSPLGDNSMLVQIGLKPTVPELPAGALQGSTPKKILLVYLADSPSVDYPLGVYTLKKYMENRYGASVQIEIKDVQIEALKDIVAYAHEFQPDILGFSVGPEAGKLLHTFMDTYRQQEPAHVTSPEHQPLIVFGKNYATFMREDLVRTYPKAVAVSGEGELSLDGLVQYLNGRQKLAEVPNLTYMEGGKLKESHRAVVEVPDTLMDFEDLERYLKVGGNAWMEQERGCSWGHCTFCETGEHWGFQNRHRPKPIVTIVRELENLSDKGVKYVMFTDEDFFGAGVEGLQRIQHLAAAIKASRVYGKIKFYTNAIPLSIYNHKDDEGLRQMKIETLRMIHEAGLQTMYLGVETGSPTQLKRFAKSQTVEDAKGAIKICEAMGINLAIGWLTIEPLVSLEEMRENIRFIRETGILKYLSSPLNELRVFKYLPYITYLERQQEKTGRKLIADEFDPVTMTKQIVGFTHPEVGEMVALIISYKEEEEDLYNSIKWFERFNADADTEQFKYLKDFLETLKSDQINLLDDLSALFSSGKDHDKIQAEIKRAKEGRIRLVQDIRSQILSHGHEESTKLILGKIDAFLKAHGADQAMASVRDLGGIDLRVEGEFTVVNDNRTINFFVDQAMLDQLQAASGIVPVVINMQPITDSRKYYILSTPQGY